MQRANFSFFFLSINTVASARAHGADVIINWCKQRNVWSSVLRLFTPSILYASLNLGLGLTRVWPSPPGRISNWLFANQPVATVQLLTDKVLMLSLEIKVVGFSLIGSASQKVPHSLRLSFFSFLAGLGSLRSDDSALHRYPAAPLVLQQAEVWFAKDKEELMGDKNSGGHVVSG